MFVQDERVIAILREFLFEKMQILASKGIQVCSFIKLPWNIFLTFLFEELISNDALQFGFQKGCSTDLIKAAGNARCIEKKISGADLCQNWRKKTFHDSGHLDKVFIILA